MPTPAKRYGKTIEQFRVQQVQFTTRMELNDVCCKIQVPAFEARILIVFITGREPA